MSMFIFPIGLAVFVLIYFVCVYFLSYMLKHRPDPCSQAWTDRYVDRVKQMRTSIWFVFVFLGLHVFVFILPSLIGPQASRQEAAIYGLSDLIYVCIIFALWHWTIRLEAAAKHTL